LTEFQLTIAPGSAVARSFHFGNNTNTALFGILDNALNVLGRIDVARRIGALFSELGISLGDVGERGRVKHMPMENVELVP